MAEQNENKNQPTEQNASAPNMFIGNGKTVYVCNTKCYHRDALYDVGHRVCPPPGGDLPAAYFNAE